MRWTRGHRSHDVIDRRRAGGGSRGLGALLPLLGTRYGWILLVVVAAVGLFGGGLGRLIGGGEQRAHGEARPGVAETREDAEMVELVSFVLDDAQGTFRQQFAQRGLTYRNAKLVLFTDATESACGFGQAASGPFYCPPDQRVYIDLSFFQELERRFGARGDFAQAYVIAHEIGHHAQNLLGFNVGRDSASAGPSSEQVREAPRSARQGAEGLSVRLELQADCFAGVWASTTKHRELLEAGDLEEALGAAAAIGDDRIQRQATGRVHPESFSHGTSAQRARWLRRGYEAGQIESCDTFSAKEP